MRDVVLLVEDNPLDAEMMMRALKRLKFVNEVRWVRDGSEAIDFARTEPPPRLMLLDLKMPKLDGLDVLREVKRDDRTRLIPVIIMTSSSQERDVVSAYRLGANGYVVKPVDFEAFDEVVAALGAYWLTVNRVPRPKDSPE